MVELLLATTEHPKVIFLDAVGTLFGVRGGVGQIYSRFAREAGVSVAADAIDRAFRQSFQSAPRMAFPGVDRSDIPASEYQWWKAIAAQTFSLAGAIEQFDDFAQFFRPLYDYFELADAWFVYDDVPLALQNWQSMGIELGVISNFDSRLYPVLEALQLSHFFDSITISTEVGAAKPDPVIFQAGLSKHYCTAAQAWHIGDSYKEDRQGAVAAGIQGIWLERDRAFATPPSQIESNTYSVQSLAGLLKPQSA
ncbi:HAD-IA family hydrolase [Pseudanabaena sp. PCC 6802]|uniref:HAD-IA family hydrolase n=1 Tax=Pseudanabaena sp. PCC 6802 TaxID=118173 RepID=UPI000346C498